MTWPIVQILTMPKMKLNYHDLFNKVRSMMKTRHDNDVTDRASLYRNQINYQDLSNRVRSITKSKHDNDVTDRIGVISIDTIKNCGQSMIKTNMTTM